jgi:hypothetical protein
VTNVVLRIKEINPSLTPFEIKNIILQTVDVKDYLKDKVMSSGILNADRAIELAKQKNK